MFFLSRSARDEVGALIEQVRGTANQELIASSNPDLVLTPEIFEQLSAKADRCMELLYREARITT